MRENQEHAGRTFSVPRIEARDARTRDRALHEHRMAQAWQREFRRVARGAGDLEPPVGTVDRLSDDLVGTLVEPAVAVVVHATAPAFCSARATVRRARSTLNALSRKGIAPTTAASLAAAMVSLLSGRPMSARSAASARHGLCATPPSVTRASATRPSATRNPVATETSANA